MQNRSEWPSPDAATAVPRALESARSGSVRVRSRAVSAEAARPRRPRLPCLPAARRRSGPCPLDLLPTELLERILALLPLRHQLAVQAVSPRWRAVVRGLLGRRRELLLGREYGDPGERVGMGAEQLRELLQLTPGLRRLNTGPSYLCPYGTMELISE